VIHAIEEPPESLYEVLGVAATAVAGPNLDDVLRALDEAGFELPSPATAVRYVVLGNVLVEPLILALRRLAEQEASARRFG
jgi:hypothetical protein